MGKTNTTTTFRKVMLALVKSAYKQLAFTSLERLLLNRPDLNGKFPANTKKLWVNDKNNYYHSRISTTTNSEIIFSTTGLCDDVAEYILRYYPDPKSAGLKYDSNRKILFCDYNKNNIEHLYNTGKNFFDKCIRSFDSAPGAPGPRQSYHIKKTQFLNCTDSQAIETAMAKTNTNSSNSNCCFQYQQ